jgi:microcystin-dependent protein
MLKKFLIGAAALAAAAGASSASQAQTSQPYIGDVMVVGYNFCPRGWAAADGQLLPVAQYSAAFSLIGTVYGGDGRTTFALPDLRGRVPIHHGQGPGLPLHRPGNVFGIDSYTLTTAQLASHNHTVRAAGQNSANQPSPQNHTFASFPAGQPRYASDPSPSKPMDADLVDYTGGGQPFSLIAPSAVIKYCVALEGIFPSRN